MARPDGRGAADLRPLVLERGTNPYAEGSCLVRLGGTLVLCTASVEPGVPGWRKGSGQGWVTAEYAMLPRGIQFQLLRRIPSLPRFPPPCGRTLGGLRPARVDKHPDGANKQGAVGLGR